jgi:hypothetical protein
VGATVRDSVAVRSVVGEADCETVMTCDSLVRCRLNVGGGVIVSVIVVVKSDVNENERLTLCSSDGVRDAVRSLVSLSDVDEVGDCDAVRSDVNDIVSVTEWVGRSDSVAVASRLSVKVMVKPREAVSTGLRVGVRDCVNEADMVSSFVFETDTV